MPVHYVEQLLEEPKRAGGVSNNALRGYSQAGKHATCSFPLANYPLNPGTAKTLLPQ